MLHPILTVRASPHTHSLGPCPDEGLLSRYSPHRWPSKSGQYPWLNKTVCSVAGRLRTFGSSFICIEDISRGPMRRIGRFEIYARNGRENIKANPLER